MQRIYSFFLLICCGALTIQSNAAAAALWYFVAADALTQQGLPQLLPESYLVAGLHPSSLLPVLDDLYDAPAATASIELPTPKNTRRTFRLWASPVMEQELQQKFRGIRTYTGFALDDPSVTVKVDYTDRGFHAMVYDGAQTFFIDPYSQTADDLYIVYYKKDYRRSEDQLMYCGIDESAVAARERNTNISGAAKRQNGQIRKTYRLALSCTGEYAKAVGGSTPVLSTVVGAMATTLNRVNGIYERELSVSFKLISNNDQLVYLDPSDDPFTANNSGSILMLQNLSNTNSVIGISNYDIGHIFSTGGGGIAQLGCVCLEEKAMGVTGSLNPVGDPFDVDYVTHEIGHQFNARHTFNRCSQEHEESAYEPGGGTTIMGYAGICGPLNNIQMNSDAYFHATSLAEISEFIENVAICGTDSTGIIPPVMPALNRSYTIPYLTFFELESPEASSEYAGALLYNWEQWNLGNLRANEDGGAYFTAGPSFRSFFYQDSRQRVFPQVDSMVKDKISMKGERLPAVARNLFFKASVRTVVDGYGAFALSPDSLVLHVVRTNQLFRVKAPNTAADFLAGAKETEVTWEVAGTNAAPINAGTVDIYLSVDGGHTFPYLIGNELPNTGSAMVPIPDTFTNRARIKVKGSNNVFFDISDEDLRIVDSNLVSVAEPEWQNRVTIFPNPAVQVLHISIGAGIRATLNLIDVLGRVVWEGTIEGTTSLPVAGYPRGLYSVRLRGSSGLVMVRKLVLQ